MNTPPNISAVTVPMPQPFDCRPQAIEKWLENLPRASVGRTAELLYKALQDIYLQDLKAAERFRTLEALRETVHYVTANMRKHFSGLAYPLPKKIMLIASAVQSIFDYMAKGYSQVFHDLQKHNFLFVDKKMLTTTVYRSITYLHRSLMVTYEIYAAYHHDYWEQLHELYHYAQIHKLNKHNISDRFLSVRDKSNIEQEYLRAILLFMAEPYHLRPGEINLANEYIEHWYGLASIHNVQSTKEVEEHGLLVVELDRDQPPQFTGNVPISSAAEHCRIIQTRQLLDELNKELAKRIEAQRGHHRPVLKKTISIGLLQRLIESWGHTRRRRYPRQQIFDKVNVTIGLHNTHMQLMYEQFINDRSLGKQHHNSFKKPKYESIDIKAVPTNQTDVWSTVYAWAANNQSELPKAIPTEQDDILSYRVKQDNWTLLNESANGFALMSVEKQANKIQVGEIISMQRADSKVREIGIVRWLKAYGNTGVEMGGMLLAPSAIPIGMIVDDGTHGDKVVNRGLLLPLMTALNRPESIMTFSRHYKTNTVIRINQPGQEDFSVRLTKCIADNETLSQFLFVRLEHQLPEHHPDESSAEIDLSRYQDVWQNI